MAAGITNSGDGIRSSNPAMKASSDGIRYRLFRGCAIALLDRPSAFAARDLVYCDPPYLMETRSGRKAIRTRTILAQPVTAGAAVWAFGETNRVGSLRGNQSNPAFLHHPFGFLHHGFENRGYALQLHDGQLFQTHLGRIVVFVRLLVGA